LGPSGRHTVKNTVILVKGIINLTSVNEDLRIRNKKKEYFLMFCK
jgi:hypothetical protein